MNNRLIIKYTKEGFNLSPVLSTSFKTLFRLESLGVTLILSISFLMSSSLPKVSLAVLLAAAALFLASLISALMSSKDKGENKTSGNRTLTELTS